MIPYEESRTPDMLCFRSKADGRRVLFNRQKAFLVQKPQGSPIKNKSWAVVVEVMGSKPAWFVSLLENKFEACQQKD